MILLPLYYFAPVSWYRCVRSETQVQFELHEKYIHQSYRNRCVIYGANGKLILTVPVLKESARKTMQEVEISYAENWMNLHWRSIQSAYGKCAYFDYFSEEVKNIIYSEEKFLCKLNEKILQQSLKWLQIKTKIEPSAFFTPYFENDYRTNAEAFLPYQAPAYYQAFEAKYGYLPDLSILDFLFQAGPHL